MGHLSQPTYPCDQRVGTLRAAIAESGTVSTPIDISPFRSGGMYLTTEFDTDVITFQGSNASDGTFAVIHGAAGAVVTFTATTGARWYSLPPELFDFAFLKVVTGTGAAAAATIVFSLKT